MKGMVFLHSRPTFLTELGPRAWEGGWKGRRGLPAGPGGRWRTARHIHEGNAGPSKHNPEVRVASSFTCRVLRDKGGLVALQRGCRALRTLPGCGPQSSYCPACPLVSTQGGGGVLSMACLLGQEPGAVSKSTRIVS